MKNKQFRSRNNRGGRGSNRSNTSKNSTAKSSKPDKTKGLESHIYNIGKSEYYVKVTDYIMNHIRQEYDQGNDIATATEKGEEKTFSSPMPIMRSVTKPDDLKEQASEIEKESHKTRMGDCEARKRSCELAHEEEVTQFVRRNVNGLPFLATISKNIMHRTAEHAAGRQLKNGEMSSELGTNYRSALDNALRLHNRSDLFVTDLEADSEFKPLLEPLQDDMDITMTFSSPQDHVKQAERNNRTIKERVRATFWRLPFESLPKIHSPKKM